MSAKPLDNSKRERCSTLILKFFSCSFWNRRTTSADDAHHSAKRRRQRHSEAAARSGGHTDGRGDRRSDQGANKQLERETDHLPSALHAGGLSSRFVGEDPVDLEPTNWKWYEWRIAELNNIVIIAKWSCSARKLRNERNSKEESSQDETDSSQGIDLED